MPNSFFDHFIPIMIAPFNVTVTIPYLIHYYSQKYELNCYFHLPIPYLQTTIGLVMLAIGLFFFIKTNLDFKNIGKGTLAPWNPPKKLVISGLYKYTRNPMITGGLFILIGETFLLGNLLFLAMISFGLTMNTIYFIFIEEPGL